MSPRPPPKISLRHDWARGEVPLGSTVDKQSEGEVVRQSQEEVARRAKFFQPTQPIPKPNCDRSGQPDNTQDVIGVQTCLSEENKNVRVEQTHDRSGQPDKHEIALRAAPELHREITTLNTDNELIRDRIEEDMDFKIPGLPHSNVKHAQSTSVRELIQKIENHPNRHALQRNLRQNQSFNPFNQESKQMIHEVRNIELCELLDTEPKTQCKVCLSYWDIGIVYCACGHFLRKEQRRIRNSSNIRWTCFLFLTTKSRKGDLTGTVTGRSRGARNTTSPISSRRSAKKKYYQGIHDRFIRDDKFRRNMIEMGRTEDICRQMDDLADEDHTHHFYSTRS